jgi:hypothetical protein
MSFESSAIPTTVNKDIKLNLNQSTIDLLNAAIASHSQTQLQQVQQQLLLSSSGIHQQHQQMQQLHQLQQLQKLQRQLQQLQQQEQKDDDKNTLPSPPDATAAQGKRKVIITWFGKSKTLTQKITLCFPRRHEC